MASPQSKVPRPSTRESHRMDDGTVVTIEDRGNSLYIDGKKVSCRECKCGHRSSMCTHQGRKPLEWVNAPGRPAKKGKPKDPIAIHAYLYFEEDGITLKPGVDAAMVAKLQYPRRRTQSLKHQGEASAAGPSAPPPHHPTAQMALDAAPRASMHYNLPNPRFMAEPQRYVANGESKPYEYAAGGEGVAILADLVRTPVMEVHSRSGQCSMAISSLSPEAQATMNEDQVDSPAMDGFNVASPSLNQGFMGGFNPQIPSNHQRFMGSSGEPAQASTQPGFVGGLELPAQAFNQGHFDGVHEPAQVPHMNGLGQSVHNQELVSYANRFADVGNMPDPNGNWGYMNAENDANAAFQSFRNGMVNLHYPGMPNGSPVDFNNQEDHNMADWAPAQPENHLSYGEDHYMYDAPDAE
ncbi:hypothetical protein GGR57DRAFT_511726 [Xylariaceae sp. FL1272]|nr:hypothetical protein GGR57DRAFT_511726 [Xylariaceae sp. FL1272]